MDARGERLESDGAVNIRSENRRQTKGSCEDRLSRDQTLRIETVLYSNPIRTTGCVLIRREAFERTGGFREDVTIIDDWLMWIELSKISPIVYLDSEILAYRLHSNSLSKRARVLFDEVRRARRSMLESPEFTKRQKRSIVNGNREFELAMAKTKLPIISAEIRRGAMQSAAGQARYFLGHMLRAVRGYP